MHKHSTFEVVALYVGMRAVIMLLVGLCVSYLIIVADAADAVSVNFSGQCKFLLI